jgi:hypothetical protein
MITPKDWTIKMSKNGTGMPTHANPIAVDLKGIVRL